MRRFSESVPFRKGGSIKKETVAKTEPQQPNNAVSSGSSLSTEATGGTASTEPNGEPTVSYRKGTTNNSYTQVNEQENTKNVENLSVLQNLIEKNDKIIAYVIAIPLCGSELFPATV